MKISAGVMISVLPGNHHRVIAILSLCWLGLFRGVWSEDGVYSESFTHLYVLDNPLV